MNIHRGKAALVAAAAAGLTLAGCGIGNSGDSGDGLVVGTTDKVVSIDPAGSYDKGSSQVQTQVYQFLLNFPAGSSELTPDAAQECDFQTPTEYVCTIKDGLTFANGNELTASDVAFSFQRIVDIDHPNGPASLLGAMTDVEATDDTTVVFTLEEPNDQTFPQVLVTSAGPIVDEETYPADEVLDDDAAVEAQGFSGPFTIGKYTKNEVAEFTKNDDYDGAFEQAQSDTVTMTHYSDSNNLKLDIENGTIDVAWRSLTPTDIESLEGTDGVEVHQGAGGELRYIVFNLKTMPGEDDDEKTAIRQAMASSLDRDELAEQVYKGTFTPAYSIVPQGQDGATEPFKDLYGEKPDVAAAEKLLDDAGVDTPVSLNLQYNTDHYGSNSDQEYNMVKRQLEATELFEVDLQSTEWNTYSEERVDDAYPLYQLGWFPDFPDADNYLTPFFGPNNFLESHYADKTTNSMLSDERTEADETAREGKLGDVQERIAEQVPVLPLLTGAQVAVAGEDIEGVDDTLDPAFKFRFTSLSKG
ncbi:ABC transporter substrate-binding protein [Aeromicrobium sp. CTD01-1L150]|uniref:ABC transporter substrate-binding protein n=1 Tax=Aeromicrobium sp. CTD01-1L150 TaxID=3341830 RepID=UPI0035C01E23